jgi:hypothetical protein
VTPQRGVPTLRFKEDARESVSLTFINGKFERRYLVFYGQHALDMRSVTQGYLDAILRL